MCFPSGQSKSEAEMVHTQDLTLTSSRHILNNHQADELFYRILPTRSDYIRCIYVFCWVSAIALEAHCSTFENDCVDYRSKSKHGDKSSV